MNAIRIITDVEGDTLFVPNVGQFKGKRVELLIFPLEDDREEMIDASLAGLTDAYDPDEPEYDLGDVRERNPLPTDLFSE